MARTLAQLSNYCFFCHGRREGINEITEQHLCNEHLKMVNDMIIEEQLTHPNGAHTPNCGCISLAELYERMKAYDTPI